MSWLFDRIRELAAVDCVEIVIAADTAEPERLDDSIDLVDVLVRASHIPQLGVTILPTTGRERTGPWPRPDELDLDELDLDELDLDELPDRDAVAQVRRLLDEQRHGGGSLLSLRGGVASLHPPGSIDHPLSVLTERAGRRSGARCRFVFATDRPDDARWFELLADRDLGIAVGGAHPLAQVNVDDVLGVVSIIDALVTLRYFAFGVDSTSRRSDDGPTDARASKRARAVS